MVSSPAAWSISGGHSYGKEGKTIRSCSRTAVRFCGLSMGSRQSSEARLASTESSNCLVWTRRPDSENCWYALEPLKASKLDSPSLLTNRRIRWLNEKTCPSGSRKDAPRRAPESLIRELVRRLGGLSAH